MVCPCVRSSNSSNADGHSAAPETFRGTQFQRENQVKVTRKVDVFSLGCVLLEAAQWVVHGPEELKAFQERRKAENKSMHNKGSYRFHNGGYEGLATTS